MSIRDYKETKDELDLVCEKIEASRKEWEENNSVLLDERDNLSATLSSIKQCITEECIEEYNESNKSTKKFDGGVFIKEMKKFDYDEVKAMKWGKENGRCIKESLDKVKFKKYAELEELEFVTIIKEPSVCFPSVIKLSEVGKKKLEDIDKKYGLDKIDDDSHKEMINKPKPYVSCEDLGLKDDKGNLIISEVTSAHDLIDDKFNSSLDDLDIEDLDAEIKALNEE